MPPQIKRRCKCPGVTNTGVQHLGKHPGLSRLGMPALPPGSAEGVTSPPAKPRTALQGQHGEGGDSRRQEQGSLYLARPRPMSPTGAANGKDKLAAALVLGRGGDVPRDIPRSCRAQGWKRRAQEHPHLSQLQGFPWDLLSETELFAAPPFPASSRCLCSLQLHAQHNPAPSPPSRGHTEQNAQSLSP